MHDAFVRIWNGAGGFDPLASQPVAWMAAIARNRALDVVSSAEATRTQSLHGSDDDDDADGVLDRLFDWSEPGADEAEDARRARNFLRDCLNELAAAERQTRVLAVAMQGQLAARFELPPAQVGRLRLGAKLAVSVEPAAGSTTGAPTGPVILVGEITA